MKVSSADFLRNYGAISDRALTEPVTITADGRDQLVVISAAEYSRLKRRDRSVVALAEFTQDEIALISNSLPPPGFEHLDEELDGWRP